MATVFHTLTTDHKCIYCKQQFDAESAKAEHENECKYWDNYRSGDKGNYFGCHQILKTTECIIVPCGGNFNKEENVCLHNGDERILYTAERYTKYSTPTEAMLAYLDNDEEGWLEIPLENGKFLQIIHGGDWQVGDSSGVQQLLRKKNTV